MNISNNNYKTLNFTSLYRQTHYKDCNGLFRSTQNTTCARDDLDYVEFANLAKEKFKNFDKINIMPMNGSDGTEAYLIANALIDVFGKEDAEKRIFPIEVTDIDKFIIENFGKKGIVALEPEDVEHFGKNFNKYFEEIPISELPNVEYAYRPNAKAYKLTPEFRKYFKFNVMDFQQRLGNLKDEGNSTVIIRNCLAQSFGDFGTGAIIELVGQKLKDTSLFIIGGYDRAIMSNMVPYMSILNFKEIGKNIFGFEKIKNLIQEEPIKSIGLFDCVQQLLKKVLA